jgi:hypothetical protein
MGGASWCPGPALRLGFRAGAARLKRGGLALMGAACSSHTRVCATAPAAALRPCDARGLRWSGRARDITPRTSSPRPAALPPHHNTTGAAAVAARAPRPGHASEGAQRAPNRGMMAREAAGLVRDLGSASPAERLEAARALEQLASDPGGAQRIQLAGGVPALLRLLQGGEQTEELQTAAASALAHMAQREAGVARDICRAGAGRAVAQSFSGSRSPALVLALLDLLMYCVAHGKEQQLFDELGASPSFLQRLARLAADPTQDPLVHMGVLGLLAQPMLLVSSRSAVAAAAAPHAAAIVQRLSSPANDNPQAWGLQLCAARLVAELADESAELAATMVAAGALPRLVQLMSASPRLQSAAVAALLALVSRQPSAAAHLAAVDGVTEALVQLLASHQPPASCQQAWDAAEGRTAQRPCRC